MDDSLIESAAEVKPFVDMFEEADRSGLAERETAHKCRDYVDGNQLTEDQVAELRRRGQPDIVINRIKRKINWLRGTEIQKRTDPKAFPRTPKHDYDAEAATQAVRYVCDNTDFNRSRSAVWEDMLVEGAGGVEVIQQFQPPMTEPEIQINQYAYDRLFWDPHSTKRDFSDARYKGAVIWSDMDQLVREYPDKAEVIEASVGSNSTLDETFDDKPYYTTWTDPKRRRTRCVLIHYKSGNTWYWAKFVKGGILETGQSIYRDDKGRSLCPLILQSAYVSRENARYGEVADMLDLQDEINKRRSKLLHQLMSRQTWGPKGAVKSVSAMKRELAKPDGHIEIEREAMAASAELGVQPFNIINQTDQTAGQARLLAEAKSEIDLQGANSALQGVGEASSGREVIARQQGGMIEITPIQDELSHFSQRVFRHVWWAVRQFWTGEKWVRVTDDPRNLKYVAINRPIPLQERLAGMDRSQVVQVAYRMGLTPNDPRLQAPVGIENSLAEMDVDILLEEVEDQITLAGETFEQLVALASSAPGSVPIEILIEATPNLSRDIKNKLIERIEQNAAQSAQQGQFAMRQQAVRNAAEIREIDAGAMEDMAQAQKHLADARGLTAAG